MMASEWRLKLYELYGDELGPGLDEFLTKIVGEDWIEILEDKDRRSAERNGTRYNQPTRNDPQSSLRMLIESIPNVARKKIQAASPNGIDGLAKQVRSDRNRTMHYAENFDDDQVHNALSNAARLLFSLGQNSRAKAFDAAANRMWNELHSIGETKTVIQAAPIDDPTPAVSANADSPQPSPMDLPPAAPQDGDYIPEDLLRGGLIEEKDAPKKAVVRAKRPVPGPAKKKATEPKKARSGQRGRKTWLVGLPAILLGLIVVVVIVRFPFDSGTPEQSTAAASPEQSPSAAPAASPAPAAPMSAAAGITVGVDKYNLTPSLPNNQVEITIKPRIGNSSPVPRQLHRDQLRMIVRKGSFDPAAWLPPGGSSSAGVPSLVKFRDSDVWAIPLNDSHLFDRLSGRKEISWATIFYDGTDGMEWSIPPSADTSRAWQLTYYISAKHGLNGIVGVGVVDHDAGIVTDLAPLWEWGAAECPCTWWP